MKSLLMLLVLGSVTTAAWANPGRWEHVYLRSTENVSVAIDFEKGSVDAGRGSYRIVAHSTWINVDTQGRQAEQVQAVLMNFNRRSGVPEIRNVNLRFENGRYTGQVYSLITYAMDCGSPTYASYNNTWYCERGSERYQEFTQEIAISIDGHWLVDPISGSHNFKFKM